jgi:hypothetical protein
MLTAIVICFLVVRLVDVPLCFNYLGQTAICLWRFQVSKEYMILRERGDSLPVGCAELRQSSFEISSLVTALQ